MKCSPFIFCSGDQAVLAEFGWIKSVSPRDKIASQPNAGQDVTAQKQEFFVVQFSEHKTDDRRDLLFAFQVLGRSLPARPRASH